MILAAPLGRFFAESTQSGFLAYCISTPKLGELYQLNLGLFNRALHRTRVGFLLCAGVFSLIARAEIFSCQESNAVSIDPYNSSILEPDNKEADRREWIVDTERGWHRSEYPEYRGACEIENGYVICRTKDIAFGEATLSIHPNGSSFVVVYTDYGIGALAFVGKCSLM